MGARRSSEGNGVTAPLFPALTVEEMQERWAEFQDVLVQNLPTAKDWKAQQKKTKKLYKLLNKKLDSLEVLDSLESQTGVPRIFMFWGLSFVFLLGCIASFFVKFMGLFLTRSLGFAFPMYASIKALITEDKSDDTQWLMYWVVYALFSLFEQVFLKQSKALPIYFTLKLVFLFWCQFANGAELLYKILIKPFAIAIRIISDRMNGVESKASGAGSRRRDTDE